MRKGIGEIGVGQRRNRQYEEKWGNGNRKRVENERGKGSSNGNRKRN